MVLCDNELCHDMVLRLANSEDDEPAQAITLAPAPQYQHISSWCWLLSNKISWLLADPHGKTDYDFMISQLPQEIWHAIPAADKTGTEWDSGGQHSPKEEKRRWQMLEMFLSWLRVMCNAKISDNNTQAAITFWSGYLKDEQQRGVENYQFDEVQVRALYRSDTDLMLKGKCDQRGLDSDGGRDQEIELSDDDSEDRDDSSSQAGQSTLDSHCTQQGAQLETTELDTSVPASVVDEPTLDSHFSHHAERARQLEEADLDEGAQLNC
eukprot:COSAG05_NODE_2476_length_3014_cov_2.823328_2_plen_266_part_00